MKLYVVRGESSSTFWPSNIVWVSKNVVVTMLEQLDDSDMWYPGGFRFESFCYEGFSKVTGIELDPGEYAELEITQQ